jgi:2-methylcitrate dehydratase PrpD
VTGVVLHDRRCWLEQFEPGRFRDPALDRFIRDRIHVAIDESVKGTGAMVAIRMKDGRVVSDRRAYPRGDAADFLTREEILAKFRGSAEGLLAPADTERAIEMLVGLADLPRVADLCAVLSRATRVAAAA